MDIILFSAFSTVLQQCGMSEMTPAKGDEYIGSTDSSSEVEECNVCDNYDVRFNFLSWLILNFSMIF